MSTPEATGFVHPDAPGAVHVALPDQDDGTGGWPDIVRMHCGKTAGIRDDGQLVPTGIDFVAHAWGQNGTCTPCVVLARLRR